MSPQTIKPLLSINLLLFFIVSARASDDPPPPNALTPSNPGLPVPLDESIYITLFVGILLGAYFILRHKRFSK